MIFQRIFENIKQIQTREGVHLNAEIIRKRNNFFQKFANCYFCIYFLFD